MRRSCRDKALRLEGLRSPALDVRQPSMLGAAIGAVLADLAGPWSGAAEADEATHVEVEEDTHRDGGQHSHPPGRKWKGPPPNPPGPPRPACAREVPQRMTGAAESVDDLLVFTFDDRGGGRDAP